ncbi:DNA alkylation repair protein [Cohnella faecalis]|uniref:DNA alkylation repair protein n=1 Tax=Cohnella faecalis TaxID=2315694 RepID=A0A398CYA6_9BACL|nr:DNA alkylation repair protein [Cohnella faecalis]RIE03984.1 DNA alkylation repair protein [Cohnella faecalis]
MEKTIKERLTESADEKYRLFSAALIPNINNVLGVRLPELRKMARTIAKGDWRAYLAEADDDYFEETMLQGMVIGCIHADIEETLRYVADFVPKIDNWSVCDSFCIGLKFTAGNRSRVWAFVLPYLSSESEYDARFGVVMLLDFFVEEEYIDRTFELLDGVKHEGYYVKMAVAWALSICFVKFPERTTALLKNNTLDNFTYNKALQKITESYRVSPDVKTRIRAMKRKK